ncbi:MAG: FixH family protein [Flavobacteriales bacterium]
MSWGYRIVILYIGFVAIIITLVSMSMSQRLDMVTPNYYQEELQFQGKIDRREAARSLKEPLSWVVEEKSIRLLFPKEFSGQELNADITFFRPSDARQDKKMSITGTELVQKISIEGMEHGYWEMKIEWRAGDKAFYDETSFRINK